MSLPKAFIDTIAQFPLLRLEFTVQLQQDAILPAFGGSMVHGFLGHALRTVSEQAFQVCYSQQQNQQPKPYSVIPDPSAKKEWQAGEVYRFEIKLFGEAVHLSEMFVTAVQNWQTKGLGEQRTPYRLVQVQQRVGEKRMESLVTHSLAAHVQPEYFFYDEMSEVQRVGLGFTTPLRIKSSGQILSDVPSAHKFTPHIVRRFCQLLEHWVDVDPAMIHLSLSLTPPNLPIDEEQFTMLENWQRFSKKSQSSISFAGIKGQVNWQGELAAHIPWLALGEQLQIGGKTTFGLGCYQLSVG